MQDDSCKCFADAYFYLADIHLSRGRSGQARETLLEGKAQYAESGDEACALSVIEQFDNYLEHMSLDSLKGLSNLDGFDEPPVPVGGFAEIQRNLVYPREALAMRRRSKVVVQVFLNCHGHPCRAPVVQSSGVKSLDLAARKAVKLTAWNPARRNGETVRASVAVPIVFLSK